MDSGESSEDKWEETEKSDLKEEPPQQKKDWFISLRKMINNPKQAIAILVIGAIITITVSLIVSVIVVLIYNALTERVVEKHYYNMTDPHKAEISDDNLRNRVLQLEEMLQNASDRISKLEEDRQYQETISKLGGRVDQLEEATTALEDGKASQDEVDQLSTSIAELNDSTSIANSRVWTTEFRRLSERVDHIDNTTVKMSEFFAVTMKVATLEGDIEQVNNTLAMKADQQHIMEMITSLRETTVKREEFQGLANTVETLKTSKADQSDLDDLDNTVTHLERTAASKTELTSLNGRVTNHITLSQNEHIRLSSRINDNDRDIQNNEYRIDAVEDELDSGGSRPLPAMAIAIISLFVVRLCIPF